jgi:hypothetical protein
MDKSTLIEHRIGHWSWSKKGPKKRTYRMSLARLYNGVLAGRGHSPLRIRYLRYLGRRE